MSNYIKLTDTIVKNNRVDFVYDYPESWKDFVADLNDRLFVEYDFDVSDIPKSILNIVFITNVLVFAMFDGTEIIVPELDESFLNSASNILLGYKRLYGDRIKDVKITCDEIVYNTYEYSGKNVLAFTGGVDATSAAASHVNEKLVLANIWGGDVRLNNQGRHDAHVEYFRAFAKKQGFEVSLQKSNFRFLYDANKIPYKFEHFWWGAIGHAPMIVGVLIPVAYYQKAQFVYLGSSYERNEHEVKNIADCNYEPIIGSIKFASGSGEQCDTYLFRSNKINNIACNLNVSENNPIKILACWNQTKQINTGENCCVCEKCARTIMDILLNGYDPKHFGFDVDKKVYKAIEDRISNSRNLPKEMWEDIQRGFIQNKAKWKNDYRVKWIFKVRINNPPKPSIIKRVKNKVRRLIKKIL